MSFSRTVFVAAIAAVVALAVNVSSATDTFRGIAKSDSQELLSSAFDMLRPNHNSTFNTDVRDDFTGRSGALAGSQVDGTYAAGTRIGFVPPVDTRDANGVSLQGPLPANLAAQHGTWMGHGDYQVVNGRAERMTANGSAVTCLPWRVTPDLGNFYLLDATASVADGETVSIGYFGEVSTVGAANTLANDLGLLVLNLERSGDTINWGVKWEQGTDANGNRVFSTKQGSTTRLASNNDYSNSDLNLQLGWMDAGNGDDLFEAWLDGENLGGLENSMGAEIDVFGVGFELSGMGSSVDSFTAAVPEPTSGLMGLMGFLALLGLRRRKA